MTTPAAHRRSVVKYQKTEKGKAYRRAMSARLRLRAIEAHGGKCIFCGFSDERALQIDHINGDGRVENKHNHTQMYRNATKELDTGKYQLLCANCHIIKTREQGE